MNRFFCSVCNYNTNKKSSWENHIASKKHMIKNKIKIVDTQTHVCNCGKTYKHISSLSRHKLKCNSKGEAEQLDMKSMFNQLLQDNQKLHKQIEKLSNQPKIIQNNKFNVITFLNHDCKNAINLSEFIENYPTTFEQLECIEKHGYIQGINDTIISSLKDMQQSERPIHCMDAKRKLFYVKDNDIWDKDNNLDKISQAISQYNTQQIKSLQEWIRQNPLWIEVEHSQNKVHKIISELSSLYQNDGHKLKKKILSEIMNATLIEK